MTRTARWTIALALLMAAAALAGCIGSATSAGDAGPTDAVDGASNADDGTEDAGDGSGEADGEAEDGDDGADDGDETSNDDDAVGNEPTPTAVPSSLTFRGCDIQVGVFDIPAPLVADQAPSGFEPTSVLTPDAPTASVIVDAHACNEATSDDFDDAVEDVGWVSYLLAVDPPDEYEAEDVDFYFVPLASVADSTEVADVYEAWSFAFEEGTVDMTGTTVQGTGTGQLHVQSENISSTLYTTVSSDPAEGDPSHKGRWFHVSDGEVTSIVEPDVSASSRSLGGAERVVEPGSSDPGHVPFWAAMNAKTTGVGQHFIAEQIDFQHLDPAEVSSG